MQSAALRTVLVLLSIEFSKYVRKNQKYYTNFFSLSDPKEGLERDRTLPNREISPFRRQPERLEADKNLPDTAADAVEKHGVQLQPEKVPEPGGAGDRLRAADQRSDLPERRAARAYEQILQQQPDADADRERVVAV